MTILDEIAAFTRERIAKAKEGESLESLKERVFSMEKGDFSFEKVLRKPGISFICECKKASPSKGIIAEEFDCLKIAKKYEEAGADCISVLSEPKWFLGKNEYVLETAETVSIPVLRKDFTVDEYMIYEAKALKASAVLLIVSILSKDELERYLSICDQLGLSALVETHDEEEIVLALSAGARIIGVNNRNLNDFSVDTGLAPKLRKLIPSDVVFVSESGIKSHEDVARLREAGADALLIGETLMRAENKGEMIKILRCAQDDKSMSF